jgi:hypothetical protein
MTETLVRFAAPGSALEHYQSRPGELETLLSLARKAWNGEVVREATGSDDWQAESRRRLQELPEPIGPKFLRMLDQLAARKRAAFAGDLRAVGDIEVRTSGSALTVSVQELHVEDLLSRSQCAYRTKHATIDMQTYLPEDDLMGSVHRDDRAGVLYLGAIAAEGSLAPADRWVQSETSCRTRTDAGRCTGRALLRRRTQEERIDWECPACGESMAISGWRGTPWDLTGRKERLAAQRSREVSLKGSRPPSSGCGRASPLAPFHG